MTRALPKAIFVADGAAFDLDRAVLLDPDIPRMTLRLRREATVSGRACTM